MASKVDICNLALSHIAQGTVITAIEPEPDGSFPAEVCSQQYPIARDILLEMAAWRFATTRVALAEVEHEHTQWRFAYTLPADIIRPLAVLAPEALDDSATERYTIELDQLTETQRIYTNIDQATLRFIVRVDDPNQYTGLFIQALSWLLAHFIAGPITKKTTVIESCYKTFLTHFQLAAGHGASSSDDSSYKSHMPSAMHARGALSQPFGIGPTAGNNIGLLPDGLIDRDGNI
jgi:hypothetical protein